MGADAQIAARPDRDALADPGERMPQDGKPRPNRRSMSLAMRWRGFVAPMPIVTSTSGAPPSQSASPSTGDRGRPTSSRKSSVDQKAETADVRAGGGDVLDHLMQSAGMAARAVDHDLLRQAAVKWRRPLFE
jgi:hypothetical protein